MSFTNPTTLILFLYSVLMLLLVIVCRSVQMIIVNALSDVLDEKECRDNSA